MYLDYLARVAAYTRTRHDFEKTIISLSPEQEKVLDQIKLLKNALGYEDENICILAYEKNRFDGLQKLIKENLGLECKNIQDKDFSFEESKGIRFCTINSSKGLDFPVVLLLADYEPHIIKDFDEATIDAQSHNLMYVAMTRAMEMLFVFANEDASSKAIQDLVSVYRSTLP